MIGKLIVCATPIGNLEDISMRALKILIFADLIAAEDTRVTKKLLNAFQIKAPIISYHEHNKNKQGPVIIDKILEGTSVVLVTDAGTPAISDPGQELVKMAWEAGIVVESIPGPSACITALSISGIPAKRFSFEGFLPRTNRQRKQILTQLKTEVRTIVLYESPHHLVETLQDLYEYLGDRKLCLCKELTKRYEENFLFTISDAIKKYTDIAPRGEFVLVIEGADQKELKKQERKNWDALSLTEHMNIYLSQEMSKKDAMKQVAADRGISKRDVYQALLK